METSESKSLEEYQQELLKLRREYAIELMKQVNHENVSELMNQHWPFIYGIPLKIEEEKMKDGKALCVEININDSGIGELDVLQYYQKLYREIDNFGDDTSEDRRCFFYLVK